MPIVSERRIHTMWKMVAIRNADSVITVFPNTFALFVERLLPELDQFERISFKMAASRIAATASSVHKLKMPEWEEMFISRLKQQLPELKTLMDFWVTGEEIAEYLPDILEGYRGNHMSEFAFHIDELHGHRDAVVSLNAYDSPTLWQRVAKVERVPRQSINVLRHEIRNVSGNSGRVELTTTRGRIELTQNGTIVSKNDG